MKKFILLVVMAFVAVSAEAQMVRSSALFVKRAEAWPVERGWRHTFSGYGGLFEFEDPSGGVNYMLGYRFNKNLLAGVGVGYEFGGDYFSISDWNLWSKNERESAVPLYLHGRYYFSAYRWAPFVGLSAGAYLVGESDCEVPVNYSGSGIELVSSGSCMAPFVDLNVGYNYRITPKQDLAFYVGIKYFSVPYFDPYGKHFTSESHVGSMLYLGTSITF